MLKIQDIADKVGVSRTTVSNVIHGKTKKVSQETIKKISDILNKEGYVPNKMPMIFSEKASKIIGLVLGFDVAHGRHALKDFFIGEFLAGTQISAQKAGYYIMLIDGSNIEKITNIASRWNIDGLIILGFNQDKYNALKRMLNKNMVLIDAYPLKNCDYNFVNVGIDDFSGGEQIGKHLLENGFSNALFLAETTVDSDYYRWLGFKKAMESKGDFCNKSRYIIIPSDEELRYKFYKQNLSLFLQAGALAFSSDITAIEAINFFQDNGISVPNQISVTGFDDCFYSSLLRPRLTTIHQDISEKARLSVEILIKMINNIPIEKLDNKNSVKLICRQSVKINKI